MPPEDGRPHDLNLTYPYTYRHIQTHTHTHTHTHMHTHTHTHRSHPESGRTQADPWRRAARGRCRPPTAQRWQGPSKRGTSGIKENGAGDQDGSRGSGICARFFQPCRLRGSFARLLRPRVASVNRACSRRQRQGQKSGTESRLTTCDVLLLLLLSLLLLLLLLLLPLLLRLLCLLFLIIVVVLTLPTPQDPDRIRELVQPFGPALLRQDSEPCKACYNSNTNDDINGNNERDSTEQSLQEGFLLLRLTIRSELNLLS